MEQNTEEWLEWRKKGIGSSDAPVIMGCLEYSTPLKLWQEKTGRKKGMDENYITEWGHTYEEKVRAWYEFEFDVDMDAEVVEHPKYPFVRCSYDGLNVDLEKGLEIKFNGLEIHNAVAKGKVPDKHHWQLVHQFLARDTLEKIDYVSYNENAEKTHALVTVKRNNKLCKELLGKESEFWALVDSDVPPPLTEKDHKIYTEGPELLLFQDLHEKLLEAKPLEEELKVYKEKNKRFKELTASMKEIKAKIVKAVDHPKVKSAGVIMVTAKSGKKVQHRFTLDKEINGERAT